MATVNGFFKHDRVYIAATVKFHGGFELDFDAFIDNGSEHIIAFLDRTRIPEALLTQIEQCPEEWSLGIGGAMSCYRVEGSVLVLGSPDAASVRIESNPLYVRLFDPRDPRDDWVHSFPPLILGFGHRTFGHSRLGIDNRDQTVEIEYRDPPTSFHR